MYSTNTESVDSLIVKCTTGVFLGLPYRWLSRVHMDENKTKITMLFGHSMVFIDGSCLDKLFKSLVEQKVYYVELTDSETEKITAIDYKAIEGDV